MFSTSPRSACITKTTPGSWPRLQELRDLGNTVVVVEHDEETIRRADYVIDLGPGAGTEGGRVVAAGDPEAIAATETSLTAQYLSGRLEIPVPVKAPPVRITRRS